MANTIKKQFLILELQDKETKQIVGFPFFQESLETYKKMSPNTPTYLQLVQIGTYTAEHNEQLHVINTNIDMFEQKKIIGE